CDDDVVCTVTLSSDKDPLADETSKPATGPISATLKTTVDFDSPTIVTSLVTSTCASIWYVPSFTKIVPPPEGNALMASMKTVASVPLKSPKLVDPLPIETVFDLAPCTLPAGSK